MYLCDMKNINRPFQKISIGEMEAYIDANGKLDSKITVCGFFLCKNGWVKVSIDEQTYIVHAGDMYLYAPSTFVNILEWSSDLEGFAFKSDLDFILPLIEKAVSMKSILIVRDKPCITLLPEQQQRIEEMADLLEKREKEVCSMQDNSPGRNILKRQVECLAEAFFNELLYDYFVNQHIEPEMQDSKERIFQTFIVSLQKNYRREREVAFYADQLCLTPRYFSSVIKEKSGQPALHWIVNMVISNAKQMLAHSDASIKEIAIDLNFPSQSFFGKYFKQYTSLSPSRYRQLYRRKSEG